MKNKNEKRTNKGTIAFISLLIAVLFSFSIRGVIVEQELNDRVDFLQTHVNIMEDRLSYDSQRQITILKMRDIIVKENPRMGVEKAYQIARINMKMAEKYPSVEPALILAIQDQESNFNLKAVSHKSAKGLMQIYPSTAKIIAKAKNLSKYNLFDPETNVDFACWLLHTLWENYIDKYESENLTKNQIAELVLADYNGGPRQVRYWRYDKNKLARETRLYVPSVLNKWRTYKAELG